MSLSFKNLEPVYPDDPGRPSITVTVDGRVHNSDATSQHGAKTPRCCDSPELQLGPAAWTDEPGGRTQMVYCRGCHTGLAVFRWREDG